MAKKELKKMKKFRFQLLQAFILHTYPKGRVADVSGGKGLLTYLLQQNGWDAVVIDPNYQPLPSKFKTLDKEKIKIPSYVRIPHITSEFMVDMGKDFDLLVGLHAHGCNRKIIDACALYHKDFILLPCCIIDEDIDPYSITDWIEYLETYAQAKGMNTERLKLNFKGQRTMIYSIQQDNRRERAEA